MSADDLILPPYPICVTDLDAGQTVTLSASRGTLTNYSAKTPVNAIEVTRYNDTFTLTNGKYGPADTTFDVKDSAGASAVTIGKLNITITTAPIGNASIAGTAKINDSTFTGGDGKKLKYTCQNTTNIKLDGVDVTSQTTGDNSSRSFEFIPSTKNAKYVITCSNIGTEKSFTINLTAPSTPTLTVTAGTLLSGKRKRGQPT